MPTSVSTDPVAVLRAVLADVERNLDPVAQGTALAAARRILLQVIAELEIDQSQDGQSASRNDS